MTTMSINTFRTNGASWIVVTASLFGFRSGRTMLIFPQVSSGMIHNMSGSKMSVMNAAMNCMPMMVVNASDLLKRLLFSKPKRLLEDADDSILMSFLFSFLEKGYTRKKN